MARGRAVPFPLLLQAHKAAASMNVRVGSFQDPPDMLGLAHFTEHMLFLGTETYPDEAECVGGVRACGVVGDHRVACCFCVVG